MAKVILVGPSKSLLKNKLGEIIDNYDIVCRMNNGGRPDILTGNYNDIIGSKRNVWLCKHIGLLNMFKDNGYDEVVGFPEADEFNEKCISILNEFNEFKFQPTCGILSIIYLLEKYNKIHVCGMDGFKGGHWYGNKFIATQEKSDEIATKGFGRHNILEERKYIDYLVKQNKINIIDEKEA